MSKNHFASPLSPSLKRYLLDANFHENYTSQQIKGSNGQTKSQQWEKARSLGRGSFGQVRQEKLMDDNGDWQYRAVKVCAKETLEHARVNFVRELSALAALSSSRHSGLFVNLLGWWTDSQNLYIATEYIPKGDLSSFVDQKLLETDAKEIVEGILNGLHIMHQEGFTHRDIKPQNVLVVQKPPESPKWWVKIADFGISKRILEENNSGLHTSIGTRYYCAPEILGYLTQSENTSVYDSKVDIWSLGCVLFNISSHGHVAFSDHELLRYCYGDVKFNPKDKELFLGSHGLALLQKFLLSDPEQRPSAADALKDQWFTIDADLPDEDMSTFDKSPAQQHVDPDNQRHIKGENYNSFLQSTCPDPVTSNNDSQNTLVSQSQSFGSTPISSEGLPSFEIVSTPDVESIASDVDPGMVRVQTTPEAKAPPESKRTVRPTNKEVKSTGFLSRFRNPLPSPKTADILEMRRCEGHLDSVLALSFSPDGGILVSGSKDKTVRLWNLKTRHVQCLRGHTHWVLAVRFSPDGRMVASGSQDETVRLWNIETGEMQRFEGFKTLVAAVAFLPDGRLVASGFLGNTVLLWDVVTGQAQHLVGHVGLIYTVAFSSDGLRLASASKDRTLREWDVSTAQEKVFEGLQSYITSLAFSPSSQLIASGSADKTVTVWDVAQGRSRHRTRDFRSGVTAVAFSPDGQIIASGLWDKTVKLWNLANGYVRRSDLGHMENISAIAFSPDGQVVASGSVDKTIRLWDVATGPSGLFPGGGGVWIN